MKQIFGSARLIVLTPLLNLSALFCLGAFAQDGRIDPPIGENSPPEVKLLTPEDGAKFIAPATIRLAAQGADRDGWIRTVEFFANDRSLGTTTNNPLSASPANPFQLAWNNVVAGDYALRAKATDDKGASTVSAAVKVSVLLVPPQAEVSVATIKGEATENGDSKSRTLIFRFIRTGPPDIDLPVFYSVQGTATMGEDFPKLSGEFKIPKGAESAEMSFEVMDDNLTEPEETVIVKVEPPQCIAIFPPPPECYLTGARPEARAVIAASDPDQIPVVSIVATVAETTEPSPEVRVQPGRLLVKRSGDARASLMVWLEIGGTAENGKDYEAIPRSVAFEAGVASKEIIVGPLDDQLVEGDETVSVEIVAVPSNIDVAQAVNYGIDLEHKAARVVIHDNDRSAAESSLEITAPKDGAEYRAPAFVKIEATAIDPRGDIRLVLFYANGQLIGMSEHLTKDAVIPGRPRYHFFEWKDVPAGRYELTARAKDTAGKEIVSKPVRISVFATPDVPVVSIEAVIGETAEPSLLAMPAEPASATGAAENAPISLVRPGRFTISRRGGGDGTLPVFFEIGGSARNGEDYKKLTKWVIIPGGTNQVNVDVAALDDSLVEGDETVEVKLTTRQSDDFPFLMPIREYAIDPNHAGARVVIHDNDARPGTATIQITSPREGQRFVDPAVINIAATAIDPKGYIARVEFYAGDDRIGVSEITFIRAPDPGTPIHHTFEWRNPPRGTHVLTARSIDSQGSRVGSAPVRITVDGGFELPAVGIRFVPDPRDIPWPDADFVPGWFEVSRTGPANTSLMVIFEVGGTATPGVDYAQLPRFVLIPAGESRAVLKIEAKDDLLPEGEETVIVALTTMPLSADMAVAAGYRIDPERTKAVAVILDNDGRPSEASLEITSPKDGEMFLNPDSIAISATAIDPKGYISRVEFYADNERIGVSELTFVRAPDPGTPIVHTIDWRQPPAGSHALTARAVDSAGGRVVSKPVKIIVERTGERVVVSIEATDPKASEAGSSDGSVDTATFTVRRVGGPRDVAVMVFYAVDGTALNGIDYKELNGQVTLAAGESSARIVVLPVPDKALEGEETVILKLKDPVCPAIFPPPPECYLIASPGSARAVIHDGKTSLAPRVVITRPASAAEFSSESSIEIVVETQDPDGYVVKVEFLADGRTIGTQSIALLRPPTHGETQKFQFVWRDAMPGSHVLTVRATDNDGMAGLSQAVEIKVKGPDSRAILTVEARDAFAVEPDSTDVNTATFVIRRSGPASEALAVKYSLHGTAENGIDYEKLTGTATIGAGLRTTTVVVRPLPDKVAERSETVILQLEIPASALPNGQASGIERRQRAAAVIWDTPMVKATAEAAAEAKCAVVAGGWLHFSFSGQTGLNFRVEVTSDFVNWETVSDAFASEGSVHFVDDTGNSRAKYYRIVPEPVALRDD
jgi:hypothetical protein